MSGLADLPNSLLTHMPVDLVVIMLGTNDAKVRFGVNGDEIARCLGRLLDAVAKSACGPAGKAPQMLVVVPPVMGSVEGTWIEPLFDPIHGRTVIEQLRNTYPPVAATFGARCFDINQVVGPGPVDGIHFGPDQLQPVATALAAKVREVLGDSAG
jgi:lysophospholipase L1-like esterase